MNLAGSLTREKNNLDAVRIIAACMVIYGHAPALTGKPFFDVGGWFFQGLDYSGSMAVKIFFFASGLVVTNSLINKPQIIAWTVARVLRLYPALILAVLVSVGVGGIISKLPAREYFQNSETLDYMFGNIASLFSAERLKWNLPGVFTENVTQTVNGSLWTLPSEFACYTVIISLSLLAVFKNRLAGTAAIIAISIFSITDPSYIGIIPPSNEILLPSFLAGSLAAMWSDKIVLSWRFCAGLAFLSILMRNTGAVGFEAVYTVCFFYGCLVLATWKPFLRFRPRYDVSYGVYLYGFPIGQIIVFYAPTFSNALHIAVVVPIALAMGCLSWMIVEKPSIRLAKAIVQSLSGRRSELRPAT